MKRANQKIRFIDPRPQFERIKDRLAKRFDQIHGHCSFIMGPEVAELEGQLSHYLGVKHAITCASGTDALILSLMALNIQAGDEVICPDFSFFASCECVSFLGGRPLFVDINPRTYNLDVRQLSGAVTERTKAVIPVSLYGQCADYDEINRICHERQIPVIEDAAQSLGAVYKGRKSGGLTSIATTSFYPTKPLGAYGDAGALFTDDDDLAQKLRELRNHGSPSRYRHTRVGMNSRMDSYQAAVLLEKLALFDEEIQLRQRVAKRYDEALQGLVTIPFIEEHNLSVYAQYTIRVHDRERFLQRMGERGLAVMVHYPRSLSQQPIYEGQYEAVCIEALKASQEVVGLPFGPYLSVSDQDLVISGVKECL